MSREKTDALLDEAASLMRGVVGRMRERLSGWEIEEAAFGVEDPEVVAARQAEEERPDPVDADMVTRNAWWRGMFRKNWPDGRPSRRRRWRS